MAECLEWETNINHGNYLKSLIAQVILEKESSAIKDAPKNWNALLVSNEMLKYGVEVLGELEKLGGEAYIVGGAARDIVLDKPIKDVDVATNVPMDKVKDNFK